MFILNKLSRGEICVANFIPPVNFSPFYNASPEIIDLKIHLRQTDRQILWHHIWVCVDFFFKLNLLPPYWLNSQGIMFIVVVKWVMFAKIQSYSFGHIYSVMWLFLLLNLFVNNEWKQFKLFLFQLNETTSSFNSKFCFPRT